MNNEKALKYRNQIPKINNFNLKELVNMPKYFGWVNYSINKESSINMFLGGNDDGVALRCFWNNHYEKKTLQIWNALCSIEGIIIDIGAHSGIYSLFANNSIKKGAVLSFEPHFLNFSRLNLNLRANNFSTETIFMNAVSKKNEILTFSVMSNQDYLTTGGRIGKVKNLVNRPVQAIALDEFLDTKAKENVKIIKIDVEGHEYQCLLGMSEMIRISQPIIFFECMSKTNNYNIEKFMKERGYKLFIIDDLLNTVEETQSVFPIFNEDNIIVHQKINRIAVPQTKINLLRNILD